MVIQTPNTLKELIGKRIRDFNVMKYEFENVTFDWNIKKNDILIKERNISFEDIVKMILEKKSFEIMEHPNKEKYPNQKLLIVNYNDYTYVVPYIRKDNLIFLKTIYPSRKLNKKLGDKYEK